MTQGIRGAMSEEDKNFTRVERRYSALNNWCSTQLIKNTWIFLGDSSVKLLAEAPNGYISILCVNGPEHPEMFRDERI